MTAAVRPFATIPFATFDTDAAAGPLVGSWANLVAEITVYDVAGVAQLILYYSMQGMVTTPVETPGSTVFEARIIGGEAMETPEALEVRAFAPDAIPWDEVAFKTSFFALRDWVEKRHPDVPLHAP